MIISRRRFEETIRRKVRAARKLQSMENRIRQQDGEIKDLKTKIWVLRSDINELQEKPQGSVRGYYQDHNGDYTNIDGSGIVLCCHTVCRESQMQEPETDASEK